MQLCGLCGNTLRGYAGVETEAGTVRLCHDSDMSCYHRWTVYGQRPEGGPMQITRSAAEIRSLWNRAVQAKDLADEFGDSAAVPETVLGTLRWLAGQAEPPTLAHEVYK